MALLIEIGQTGWLTNAELHDRTNRIANLLLGRGLQRGDRVALMVANRPEVVEILEREDLVRRAAGYLESQFFVTVNLFQKSDTRLGEAIFTKGKRAAGAGIQQTTGAFSILAAMVAVVMRTPHKVLGVAHSRTLQMRGTWAARAQSE